VVFSNTGHGTKRKKETPNIEKGEGEKRRNNQDKKTKKLTHRDSRQQLPSYDKNGKDDGTPTQPPGMGKGTADKDKGNKKRKRVKEVRGGKKSSTARNKRAKKKKRQNREKKMKRRREKGSGGKKG